MSWINVAIMAGTTVIGAEEQRSVAKKQDNQLALQLRQQSATEDAAKQRTQQFIQQQQQQTDAPQKTAAAQQYQTALDANKNTATQPLAGNVSDAYKKAGSDAALGIASYGNNLGNLTASIDAPGLQRQQNQRNIDDYGTDVNQINAKQKGQDFLDQMKLNSIQANPYVGLITGAANSYAKARLVNTLSTPNQIYPWARLGYGGIDSTTAPTLGAPTFGSTGDYSGYA